jgi:predicted transcriptional regulator
MDIQTEKIKLIEWLAGVSDAKLIEELLNIKRTAEQDWWDEISEEERSEISEGLKQADRGNTVLHEEAMNKYKKWRSK